MARCVWTLFATLWIAGPVAAQSTEDPFQPDVFAGTVLARDLTGLSYEAGGCIVAVSDRAKRLGVVEAGQVLVELDREMTDLAVRTARAKVADLEAAVEERQLAIDAAEADVARRAEERAFVDREFTRSEAMFQRGLINETTMDTVERRMLDAKFAADRASEALASARSARLRAEIALEIGELDLKTRSLDLDDLALTAPFDGILLGFEPNVGDCVQAGAPAAQIYAPQKKSVEIFVRIDQLVASGAGGVAIGTPVRVIRVNGEACGGTFTWIGTEANLETQYVKSTIDVDEACAPTLYINEAVDVETLPPRS